MDSVCAQCACRGVCVCVSGRGGGRGGSAGKGCVYPICSLPLPCGRKNHWPAPSLIPEDTEAERQALERREREREGSRPQGVAKEPAGGENVCVCVYACAH